MAKMGRPTKDIDWTEFEKLCLLQCSIEEMCQWFSFSHQSLERKVKEHYGETFGQVFAKKRVGGLISLRRNLFKQSEHSAAVAIFLAKNLLGMTDKQEITGAGGGPVLLQWIEDGNSNKNV
jgi:hypothetical protein